MAANRKIKVMITMWVSAQSLDSWVSAWQWLWWCRQNYRASGSKISLIRQSRYYSLWLITHPLLFIINNPPTFVYMYSWASLEVSYCCKLFVFSRSISSYLSRSEGTKQTEPIFATTYKLVSYGVQIQLVEKLFIDILSTITWFSLGWLMVLRK